MLHLSDDNITTRLPVVLDEDSVPAELLGEQTTPIPLHGETKSRRALGLDPWHCGCGLRIATRRRERHPDCLCGINPTASIGLAKRTRTVRPLVSNREPIVRMVVFDHTQEQVGEVYVVSASDIGSVRSRWALGIAIRIDDGEPDFTHLGLRYRFVRFFAELDWLQHLRVHRDEPLLLMQGPHVLRICDALINCDNAPMDLVVERVFARSDR